MIRLPTNFFSAKVSILGCTAVILTLNIGKEFSCLYYKQRSLSVHRFIEQACSSYWPSFTADPSTDHLFRRSYTNMKMICGNEVVVANERSIY